MSLQSSIYKTVNSESKLLYENSVLTIITINGTMLWKKYASVQIWRTLGTKTGPKLCCSNFLKSLSDGVQGLQWSDINMDILVNVSQNKEISMAYLVK